MTVEQIAIRQEVRQLLAEAGINKNTMKDLVRDVVNEELNKAVRQIMHEINLDEKIGKLANGNIQEAIRRELRDSIDKRVNGVFSRMSVSVTIKNASEI